LEFLIGAFVVSYFLSPLVPILVLTLITVNLFFMIVYIQWFYLFVRRIIKPKKKIDMTFLARIGSKFTDKIWKEKDILQKYHDSHWKWMQKNRFTDAFIGVY
jgi:hypothetical protein